MKIEKMANQMKVWNDEAMTPPVFIRAESEDAAAQLYSQLYRKYEHKDFSVLGFSSGRIKAPDEPDWAGLVVGPEINVATLAPLHGQEVVLVQPDGEQVTGTLHLGYSIDVDLTIDTHTTKWYVYKPKKGDQCLIYDQLYTGIEVWFTPKKEVV